MLPILLYEPLPLIYLCGGAALLVKGQSGLLLISAFLFYWAGALIWILRSKNRRTDIRSTPPNYSIKHLPFPEALYEFRPFFYSFIGILLFRNSNQTVWLVIGSILILWTIYCLYRRDVNRCHVIRHQHSHLLKPQHKNVKLKTKLF